MVIELHTVPSSALTPAQADDVITLCSEVFRLDYSFYMNLDYERVHVLGYAGSRLVAHALWLTRRLRIGPGPWLAAANVEGVARRTRPWYAAHGFLFLPLSQHRRIGVDRGEGGGHLR
ncbi:MAG: hypothetical protein NT169_05360 [Chloroflexi bacterium]|nr:hypothetical protein [Chloroflexota bacterium]